MIRGLHGFTSAPSMWAPLGIEGPHLLGHGGHATARGGETFAGEVLRLSSILPNVPLHLVGYSLGGRLALALAIAKPERVKRLTLIGAHPGIEGAAARNERTVFDASWATMLRTQGLEAFVDAWQALPLWSSQDRLTQEARSALQTQRLSHCPEQLAHAMDALGTSCMPPMWHQLKSLQIPVQLVVGELDHKYTGICERMHALMPTSSIRSIANAGHNPVLENPLSVRDVIHEAP